MMDLTLKNLNPEQKKAVTHGKGPLLIVAGAGTGKTTVITQRLGWLIEQKKANPDEILALTFTEKAAGEMEERVDQLLPYGYVDLWVSTFHAFGERILRDWALEIGLDSGFKVLSRAEQWLLIQQNLDEFDLDYYKPLGNPTRFIQALIQHFSRIKDENISAEEYISYAQNLRKKQRRSREEKEEAEKILEVAQAYQKYQELLIKNGYFDFGDLIIRTLELFQKRKKVLEKFRKQFKYILVDEFQDTNHAQYELLKLLAAPKNNLTVVGDDDQAIYRFRGAAMSNILEFKKDFPQTEEVVLTKNYRSYQNILDLAYQFIQLNNPDRLEVQLKQPRVSKKGPKIKRISKKLIAQARGEAIIKYLESGTEEDEVLDVLREILKLKQKDVQLTWNDFAILVRANNQADIFVKTFINQEVPYQFVAARGLYQQPVVLDIIAWLRMLDNYHESPSLFRVLSMDIFGIDTRDLIQLLNYSNRKRISLFETLERSQEVYYLQNRTKKIIHFLLDLIKRQTELAKTKSVGQVCFDFLKAIGYLRKLSSKDIPDYHIKIQNIAKFFRKIQEFEKTNEDKSVKNFVEELKLVVDIGEDPAPAQMEEGPESVKIMTVHGAKGLEFPYVFVVNLVDKRFPSTERREPIEVPFDLIKEILPQGDVHLQEERRLFYVAATRAKKGLYFTSAQDVGGKTRKKPSRFLYEIKIKKEEKEKLVEQLNLGFDLVAKKIKKEKITYPLPERFSYTQLKAYETCPKQYKYAHIWKVPVLTGRHTYSFGTSVHSTLKAFYTLIQRGLKPTISDLLKIYEENWIDEWYDSKKHEQERKKAGKKMLEEFYEKNKNRFKAPAFLEKGFNLKIGEYSLKGFIDRVDRIGENSVEIIDYKTGQRPKSKYEIDHDQLLIYYLAMKEVFRKEATLLSYYYVDGNTKYSFTADTGALQKLEEKIKTTVTEIRRCDFTATPSVYKCSHCDFREICEERAV